MSNPQNESEFATELNQLLAAAALGDATDAQVCRLNELLLRDEGLRRQAARFFEEEVVLRREFEVLDRVGEFHNPRSLESSDRRDESHESATRCRARFGSTPGQRLFVAVALLVSSIIGWLWFDQKTGSQAANDAGVRALLSETGIESTSHGVQPLTACILTPVTRVSWAGPQFASERNSSPMISAIREGVIPFTSAFGRPAQGYLVRLRPHALLDLVVTADAEGENALAVIELDGTGRSTGRRFSFSNSAGEDSPDPADAGKYSTRTKKGRLGIWSERNDSDAPRYYLFTSVHKLLNRAADDSWHVSRLLPFVEEPDLIHVGWDDSGMLSSGEQDLVHIPDNDFDDASATIRIRNLDHVPSESTAGVHLYSKTAAYEGVQNLAATAETNRYPLTVAPGHAAIIKVSSRSGAPVEVGVYEKESADLAWRCRQERNSNSPTLGICAIENNTSQPREFFVVGNQKEPAADANKPGRPLSHSVLFDKEDVVTIGFDNGKMTSGFDQLKVDILTLGDM
ncbi:MAG TPA: hypothetical protein VHU84_01275 [Lacipirellulaceae bacterium]|jgi:hypothetical protein|nr:hypothetical protein [Lacipirellulaceae bacterium]